MDKHDKVIGGIILAFLIFLIGVGVGGTIDPKNKYKQGQIDVLTGDVKYELRTNLDSTVTWYKKGE